MPNSHVSGYNQVCGDLYDPIQRLSAITDLMGIFLSLRRLRMPRAYPQDIAFFDSTRITSYFKSTIGFKILSSPALRMAI